MRLFSTSEDTTTGVMYDGAKCATLSKYGIEGGNAVEINVGVVSQSNNLAIPRSIFLLIEKLLMIKKCLY